MSQICSEIRGSGMDVLGMPVHVTPLRRPLKGPAQPARRRCLCSLYVLFVFCQAPRQSGAVSRRHCQALRPAHLMLGEARAISASSSALDMRVGGPDEARGRLGPVVAAEGLAGIVGPLADGGGQARPARAGHRPPSPCARPARGRWRQTSHPPTMWRNRQALRPCKGPEPRQQPAQPSGHTSTTQPTHAQRLSHHNSNRRQ